MDGLPAHHANDAYHCPACRGVFPRPADISKEFGGGRTLKPGEVWAAQHLHHAGAVPLTILLCLLLYCKHIFQTAWASLSS